MAGANWRPPNGFMAWQSTVGYLNTHHSADASLFMLITPLPDDSISWTAGVSWSSIHERVEDHHTLSDALAKLWTRVSERHNVFLTADDAIRAPSGYQDSDWLDIGTLSILQRIIMTMQSVASGHWSLTMMYQPSEHADRRIELSLKTEDESITGLVHHQTLLHACRALYRHIAPQVVYTVQQRATTVTQADE